MNVLKIIVFIIITLKVNSSYRALCTPGSDDQKSSSEQKKSEIEEKNNKSKTNRSDEEKKLTESQSREEESEEDGRSKGDSAKEGDQKGKGQEKREEDQEEQKGKEVRRRQSLYEWIDVDLRRINSRDFMVLKPTRGREYYKLLPMAYKKVRSIRLDGKVIWVKNRHVRCGKITIFNEEGNKAELVISTYDKYYREDRVGVELSRIREVEGRIKFEAKYMGFFETVAEVNREVIEDFYVRVNYRKVEVDVEDNFDKLYFEHRAVRAELSPEAEGNEATTTSCEYEVFEPNDEEVFVKVKHDSRLIWKSLVVGGYEFGTKRVEKFKITKTKINKEVKENSSASSSGNGNGITNSNASGNGNGKEKEGVDGDEESVTSESDGQKAHEKEEVEKKEIYLIRITIKNNYHHHLMYNIDEQKWEMISKEEFEKMYVEHKLEHSVEIIENKIKRRMNGKEEEEEGEGEDGNEIDESDGIKNRSNGTATGTGNDRGKEISNDKGSESGIKDRGSEKEKIEGLQVIDISRKNEMLSYEKHNLLKHYVVVMSIKVKGKDTGTGDEKEKDKAKAKDKNKGKTKEKEKIIGEMDEKDYLDEDRDIEDLDEDTSIFQINYKNQVICHVFGTNFRIEMTKTKDKSYIEIVNITKAKNIGNSSIKKVKNKKEEKNKSIKGKIGVSSTANTVNSTNSQNGTSGWNWSSRLEEDESEEEEFEYVGEYEDVIFATQYYEKKEKSDNWVKISPFQLDYMIIRNIVELEESGSYDYNYSTAENMTEIADVPIEIQIKFNGDKIPENIKIKEMERDKNGDEKEGRLVGEGEGVRGVRGGKMKVSGGVEGSKYVIEKGGKYREDYSQGREEGSQEGGEVREEGSQEGGEVREEGSQEGGEVREEGSQEGGEVREEGSQEGGEEEGRIGKFGKNGQERGVRGEGRVTGRGGNVYEYEEETDGYIKSGMMLSLILGLTMQIVQ